jgi:predicted CopG family antitoxin
MATTIHLKDDTYKRLKSLGKKDETFDQLVKKLLDSYDGVKRR